jgi:serine/threonine protein kinase/Tol biopolymer transport system component
MALPLGSRLGPYEVTAPIGMGGMGEVYKATDTNLKRAVAIKVLPASVAADAERLARFQREAEVLASLNHPNIAAIYGLERSGNMTALVMELVEGPTLADRIAQEATPIDEALPIAKQIAEALEAAHEQGIIHRDLKPANIKVREDGTVKVLDFGLAKVLGEEPGASSDQRLSMSPTITSPAAMTGTGVILGTAAYMSPEQARGRPVDKRADIWAFGCVLYEMVTAKAVFHGESVTDTLAAVIHAEPNWSLLPNATSPSIRALLRRCLHKDVRLRLQAIGDARIALEETLSGSVPAEPTPGRTQPRMLWLTAGLASVSIVAAVTGLVVWNLKPSAQPRPVTRFTIALPSSQALAGLAEQALAFSADGSQLAYLSTTGEGAQQIYLRAMNGVEGRPVRGTERATNPFFSPDGQWLGFFADGKLKKVLVNGGVAQDVVAVPEGSRGASWASAHTIAFAPYSSVLQQVSDRGGAPGPITRFETGETLHTWPQFLPGGNAVLFTAVTSSPTAIAVQSIGTGERRTLIKGQATDMPSYAPSGHLVYAQAGNLMAVPFDLDRLEAKGDAVPVEQGVLQYTVSATGSLAYISGKPQTPVRRLVWVSRDGTEQLVGAPARFYNQPRLSPDGRRVAVDVVESAQKMQVWLYDLERDTLAPFTFESVNRHAVWTPDGKRIAFMSNREGATQIFWQLADGSGGLERLTSNPPTTTADILNIPYSWSPEGQLTFVKVVPTSGAEFWVLQTSSGSGKVRTAQRVAVQVRNPDGAPQLSPDGRWLAYAADDDSGRREIYVQPYPGLGGKFQISTGGGNEPQWSRDGRELFYRSGNKMIAVAIATEAGFVAGKPTPLFEGNYASGLAGWVRANYDVSKDGRFLMIKPANQGREPLTQINVVLNWSEELKRLVPTN